MAAEENLDEIRRGRASGRTDTLINCSVIGWEGLGYPIQMKGVKVSEWNSCSSSRKD